MQLVAVCIYILCIFFPIFRDTPTNYNVQPQHGINQSALTRVIISHRSVVVHLNGMFLFTFWSRVAEITLSSRHTFTCFGFVTDLFFLLL